MSATANELAIVVTATQTMAAVPFHSVHTLAVAEVKSTRYWTFVGIAGLLGSMVTIVSNRWAPGAFWTGLALGVGVTLTALLAGRMLPVLHRWLVPWRPVYKAPNA